MKKIVIFLIFFLSIHVHASDVPTWGEKAGYKLSPKHDNALVVAKKYTENETINGLTVHYEYKISTTKEGFYVFVVKFTLNKEQEKLYYPGGHFSLDIDKHGNIIKLHPGA